MTAPDASARDLVLELIAVTDRLNELLAAETALLGAPGVPDITGLVPEKSKLAVRYDLLSQALVRQPAALVAGLPEASRLGEAVRRLGRLAQDNARAVSTHIGATRRVVELVSRAAHKASQPSFSYGKQRLGYGARSGRNAAIAVNRVL